MIGIVERPTKKQLQEQVGILEYQLAAVTADLRDEIGRLRAALHDVIADIHEYERVNNLAPNPPRMECWDSVARAQEVLGLTEPPGVEADRRALETK
jgi:hypothetical protein